MAEQIDMGFLDEYVKTLNAPRDVLEKEFQESLGEMKKLFPQQDNNAWVAKAKAQLKVKYKNILFGSNKPFTGFIIGYSENQDRWAGARTRHNTAINEAVQQGTIAELMKPKVDGKANPNYIAAYDRDGKTIVPLYPPFKNDGKGGKVVSKLAGRKLADDTATMQVLCVARKVNSKGLPKGYILELSGQALKGDIPLGMPVAFTAGERGDENAVVGSLVSSTTRFVKIDDPDVTQYLATHKLTDIVKKKFVNNVISQYNEDDQDVGYNKLDEWRMSAVPEFYRNSFVIVDARVQYINALPTDGKGRVMVDGDATPLNKNTQISMTYNAGMALPFGVGTRALCVFSPYVMSPRGEDTEPSMRARALALIPYPEDMIPAVNAQLLSEENVHAAGSRESQGDVEEEF